MGRERFVPQRLAKVIVLLPVSRRVRRKDLPIEFFSTLLPFSVPPLQFRVI